MERGVADWRPHRKQGGVRAGKKKKRTLSSDDFIVMFKIGLRYLRRRMGHYSPDAGEEFGDRRGWIEEEDLIDFLSLGRSFPGIMIINTSVIFGYTVAGF